MSGRLLQLVLLPALALALPLSKSSTISNANASDPYGAGQTAVHDLKALNECKRMLKKSSEAATSAEEKLFLKRCNGFRTILFTKDKDNSTRVPSLVLDTENSTVDQIHADVGRGLGGKEPDSEDAQSLQLGSASLQVAHGMWSSILAKQQNDWLEKKRAAERVSEQDSALEAKDTRMQEARDLVQAARLKAKMAAVDNDNQDNQGSSSGRDHASGETVTVEAKLLATALERQQLKWRERRTRRPEKEQED
jgi:hypothetical protein